MARFPVSEPSNRHFTDRKLEASEIFVSINKGEKAWDLESGSFNEPSKRLVYERCRVVSLIRSVLEFCKEPDFSRKIQPSIANESVILRTHIITLHFWREASLDSKKLISVRALPKQ